MDASGGSGTSLSVVEYQSLYAEIADSSRRIAAVLQICVLGFTSVMAFISSGEDLFFAQHDKAVTLLPKMLLPGMLLLPSFIILMCLAMIRSSFITIVRTGTYILVFYERHDPSISWQARIQQMRLAYPKSRSLRKSLWYVFLPLFVSSLLLSFSMLCSINMGLSAFWTSIVLIFYVALYAGLSIIFWTIMEDLLYVWSTRYFGKMINRWIKLQEASTNALLKQLLTSGSKDQVFATRRRSGRVISSLASLPARLPMLMGGRRRR